MLCEVYNRLVFYVNCPLDDKQTKASGENKNRKIKLNSFSGKKLRSNHSNNSVVLRVVIKWRREKKPGHTPYRLLGVYSRGAASSEIPLPYKKLSCISALTELKKEQACYAYF